MEVEHTKADTIFGATLEAESPSPLPEVSSRKVKKKRSTQPRRERAGGTAQITRADHVRIFQQQTVHSLSAGLRVYFEPNSNQGRPIIVLGILDATICPACGSWLISQKQSDDFISQKTEPGVISQNDSISQNYVFKCDNANCPKFDMEQVVLDDSQKSVEII